MKLETFLNQSKFAANSIHKFITTFPLPISLFIVLFIFVITTLSFAGLRASRFASGHSHTARVLCCGPRSSGSPVRTALRRAALCSAALAQAAPGLQLQNRPEASAPFSMSPPPPSQRRAIDPSRDIPDRCQQMVLCVQPSSRHALPGTRLLYSSATAFRDASPRLEPWPRRQHGATPREDVYVFPFNSTIARMSRYGLAMPVLDNAGLLTLLTQQSCAGSSYLC